MSKKWGHSGRPPIVTPINPKEPTADDLTAPVSQTAEVLPPSKELARREPLPFLALGVVKVGADWHLVQLDAELVPDDGYAARVVGTFRSEGETRAGAIERFKATAVRRGVTA